MGVILGIDFGTVNTTVSYVDTDGTVKLIPSSEGYTYFPTLVYIDPSDKYVYTGESALYESFYHPQGLIKKVRAFITEADFCYCIGGRDFSVDYVIGLFFDSVMKQVEDHLGDVEIDGAVIACPCYYTKRTCARIAKAAERAVLSNGQHLKVLTVVTDSIAAAAAHYLSKNEAVKKTVLVYDLGGSFDVTLMRVESSKGVNGIKILDVTGDQSIGGDEWSREVGMYLVDNFIDAIGVDPDKILDDMDTRFDVERKAEKATRILSQNDSVSLYLSYEGQRERISITRETFEDITEYLLIRTLSLTDKLLYDSGTAPESIDEILLCGRATRMPQIKTALTKAYGRPVIAEDPDNLVSIGSAILGNSLCRGI